MLKNLDTYFPYPTPKIARIKDSKLGLLRYGLMFAIFLYIVLYQIMWLGAHLSNKSLSAVYQLQLDHPTRNHCNSLNVDCMQNFSSMATLPYCAQSPLRFNLKLPCQLWDAPKLHQVTDEGFMIPTHVATFMQEPGCQPSAANNWTCVGWLNDFVDKAGHVQLKRGKASPTQNIYIADVEKFTLLIDHSVRSRLGHQYYANQMQGYWLDCSSTDASDASCTPRPIHCGGDHYCVGDVKDMDRHSLESGQVARGVRRSLSLAGDAGVASPAALRGRRRPASLLAKLEPGPASLGQLDVVARGRQPPALEEPNKSALNKDLNHYGVVSEESGDVFFVGKLLSMANISLDKRRHNVPSWVGGSYRSSGLVLVIRIHYTNSEIWMGLKAFPWHVLGPPVHYTYRVTKHASHDDYMLTRVHVNQTSHERVLKEFHGIRILLEQAGNIAVWDNVQLLLILTTTLALIYVANCITDTVAMNCMARSDEYYAIKYERPVAHKREHRDHHHDTDTAMETDGEDNIQRYSSLTM